MIVTRKSLGKAERPTYAYGYDLHVYQKTEALRGVRIVGAQPFATFQSAIDALVKNPVPAEPNGQGSKE